MISKFLILVPFLLHFAYAESVNEYSQSGDDITAEIAPLTKKLLAPEFPLLLWHKRYQAQTADVESAVSTSPTANTKLKVSAEVFVQANYPTEGIKSNTIRYRFM